ncbi:MAG: hypothetical protein M0Z93_01150 [Actinomycetota bacterium]|jgi:hypothetical protein|nr:hypothetical protein [Actinomycetota bacterium]
MPEEAGDRVVPTVPVPGADGADGADPGVAHLSLAEAAAVVGGYVWIERQLAAAVGAWATRLALPAVQVHLAAQSGRHGWHAELWAERLPRLDGLNVEALCRPPSPAVGEVIGALDPLRRERVREPERGGPSRTDEPPEGGTGPGALPFLAGLYRVVLPRLVVSYQAHLRAASPVSDGPVIRALRLVVADELEDWHDGELLVQRLVRRPHDVDAAAGFQKQLEAGLVRAGAHPGLTRLPDGVT